MSKAAGRWRNKYEGESDDEDHGAGSRSSSRQGPGRGVDHGSDRDRSRDRDRERDRRAASAHSSDDSDNDRNSRDRGNGRKNHGSLSTRRDDGDHEDEIEVITTRVMKRMPSVRNDRPAGAFVPKSTLPYERPPKARPAFSEEPVYDNQTRGRKERDREREREYQNQNRNSTNTDSSSEWARGGRRAEQESRDRTPPRKSQPWTKGGSWVDAQDNYIAQGSRDHSPSGGSSNRRGEVRRSEPPRHPDEGRRSRDSSAFDGDRRRDRRDDSVRGSREASETRRQGKDRERPRERGDPDYDRGDRYPRDRPQRDDRVRSSREPSETRSRSDLPSGRHREDRSNARSHRYDASDESHNEEEEEDNDTRSQSSYYEANDRERDADRRYRRGSEESRNAPIGVGGSSSAPLRPSPDGHTDNSRTPDTVNSQPTEAFYKVWNPPPLGEEDDPDVQRAGSHASAMAMATAMTTASRRNDAIPLSGADTRQGLTSSLTGAATLTSESAASDPTAPSVSKPSFVLVAHPRGVRCQHIQCTVLRDRHSMHGKLYPQYELILEDPRRTLIVARKMSLNRTSNYHLFDMTRGQAGTKLSKKAGNYLGKLRSKSAQRTDYSLLNQKADKEEIAAIGFDKITLLGQLKDGNQPRKMRIVVPQPCAVNGTIDGVNATAYGVDTLHDLMQEVLDHKRILPEGLLLLETKEPVLENGNYRLNFFGRVSLPSVKNFQIVHASNIDNILCQFGKVDEDIFHLDYKAPFNAVQAFALALCQFNL